MVTLESVSRVEIPSFQKALDRAITGDKICIGPEPEGIKDSSARYAHMTGVLSVIGNSVFLNNVFVCNNDVRETSGLGFLPFYDKILIHRTSTSDGKRNHEFYWLSPPSSGNQTKSNSIVPKPAFKIEADELKIVPLASGKGLILIESKPVKRIMLLKKLRVLGTVWNRISDKNVFKVCEKYVQYQETPSSIVVGVEMSSTDGMPVTRFFRGHGRNRVAIHDHPGTSPLLIWATDDDFFYKANMHGEEVIVSTATGATTHYDEQNDLFATSTALIQRKGTRVEVNGMVITNSFVADWTTAHADGILYGCGGEIKMLVVKGDLKKTSE